MLMAREKQARQTQRHSLLLTMKTSLLRVSSGFEDALAELGSKITEQMNEALNADITSEEIRTATFQMHLPKSPGTNGFHAIFYQKFETLQEDIW